MSGPNINGSFLQDITAATCPTDRIRAVDARDNHTYWVQKLDDGKCWMLTNLAYAGGGTNTYNDTKTLTNGTSDTATTYTEPKYYIPSGANPTTEPTNPSTSTTGTGQYGYLYNWCAAMGGQDTAACANATTTPAPIPTTNICPAGWRLPTGGAGGEFEVMNNIVYAGKTDSDSSIIGAPGLFQRSGYWSNGFGGQGSSGDYWSSTQLSAASARNLNFNSANVLPAYSYFKYYGFAVRCVAE